MRKTFFTLLTIAVIFSQLKAQNAIYSEQFNGSLGEWTPISVDCDGDTAMDSAFWTWDDDGIIGPGESTFSEGNGIVSPTSFNGVAIFNSDGLDGLGSCPIPHTGELVSPSYDFSSNDEVVLTFYQGYRPFVGYEGDVRNPSLPNSFVSVSADSGTTWTEYAINENVGIGDFAPASETFQAIDISSVAANQSNVQVKFTFRGDYFYWAIDDVVFYDQGAQLDLAISELYYPLNAYRTPSSQIGGDTIHFAMTVTNLLDETVENAKVTFSVAQVESSGSTELFVDSIQLPTLEGGAELDVALENSFYVPELDPGNYVITYAIETTGEVADFNPVNNMVVEPFIVTNSEYSKVRRLEGRGPSFNNDAILANIYQTNPNYLEPLILDQILFSCYPNSRLIGNYDNHVVRGYVVEVPSSVTYAFGDFEPNNNPANDQLLQGIAERTLVSGEENDGQYQMTIMDAQSTDREGVAINPGTRYMIATEYAGTAIQLIPDVAEEFNYNYCFEQVGSDREITLKDYDFCTYQNATWLKTTGADWSPFLGYLEDDDRLSRTYTASIGVTLSLGDTTTSVDQTLAEGVLYTYPNPAPNELNVELDLDYAQTVNIFFADISGRILSERVVTNFRTGKFEFNTHDYTPGTYLLRVVTEQGAETRPITVIK